MATIDQLINMFTTAQNQANTANQERLDQIMGLLEGQGESSKNEARRMSAERTAGGDQSLMDRGLFNTTILDSQRRREGETLGRQLAGIDEAVALNRAGVLERVSDVGPDMGAWASLISQLAMNQGGQGKTHNFGGINRLPGWSHQQGGGGGGGGRSGGGGGGGGMGGGATTYYGSDNPSPNNIDPFANQSLADLQQNAQQNQGGNQTGPNGERYYIISGTYGSGWSDRPPSNFTRREGNTFWTA